MKRLALTHHDPLRTDTAVDRIVEYVRSRLRADGSALEVFAAAEALSHKLKGYPGSPDNHRSTAQFPADTAIDTAALKAPVILCAADSELKTLLAESIVNEGLRLATVDDGADLPERVFAEQPALVLIEHSPPAIHGVELVRAIRENEVARAIQVPIVIVSMEGNQAGPNRGGATDWLVTPLSMSYARTKIRAWVLRVASHWIRAGLPINEHKRLDALYQLAILDTPAEERYDRVTRIAALPLMSQLRWSALSIEIDSGSSPVSACKREKPDATSRFVHMWWKRETRWSWPIRCSTIASPTIPS